MLRLQIVLLRSWDSINWYLVKSAGAWMGHCQSLYAMPAPARRIGHHRLVSQLVVSTTALPVAVNVTTAKLVAFDPSGSLALPSTVYGGVSSLLYHMSFLPCSCSADPHPTPPKAQLTHPMPVFGHTRMSGFGEIPLDLLSSDRILVNFLGFN